MPRLVPSADLRVQAPEVLSPGDASSPYLLKRPSRFAPDRLAGTFRRSSPRRWSTGKPGGGAGRRARTRPWSPRAAQRSVKGLSTWTPASSKSLTFAGDHGHVVHPRRRRDERVNHRKGLGVLLAAPGSGDRESDREDSVFEPGFHILKPAFKGGVLLAVTRPRILAIPCSIELRTAEQEGRTATLDRL
jgi:hypothetical protein